MVALCILEFHLNCIVLYISFTSLFFIKNFTGDFKKYYHSISSFIFSSIEKGLANFFHKGPDTRKKSEKVLCKYFHSQNLQKAVTTETIKGLQPGKSYLLDVYVTGHGGHSVKYQSKVVKTRKFC